MECFGANSSWFPYVGAFAGACLGSFLNVCAHRMPLGISIVVPGSRCFSCKCPIPWYLNLPLVGYLFVLGRARCCDARIPPRYLVVEIVLAALYFWFFMNFTFQQDLGLLLSQSIFAWILVGVVVIDLETMTIPDRFSMGGLFAGLFLSICFPSIHLLDHHPFALERWSAGLQSLLGILVGSGTLYWIGALAGRAFGREALGEGDVKLLGCIGAFCGWQGAIFSIFGGAAIGCLFLLPGFFLRKASEKKTSVEWGREVPFGPYLSIAALVCFLLFNREIKDWFDPFLQLVY